MAKQHLTYGIHAVTSLLENSPEKIKQLWVKQGRDDNKLKRMLSLAAKQQLAVQQVPQKTLDKLVDGRHQGVVAEVCQQHGNLNENDLKELLETTKEPFLLILDGVEDPHNLGACLRSADAAGVTAVIVPKDKAVGITSTVSKVACGAAETVPFIQVTNLARTLERLKQQGIWLYGAAGEADKTVYEQKLTGAVGLVMGAEGKGLRRLTREHCDFLIKIPLLGHVESLNVSVATGICLFEILRQRANLR